MHFFHLVSDYTRHSDPFHPLKLCQQSIFSSLDIRLHVFAERARHPRRYFATSLDIRVHVFPRTRYSLRVALISNTSVDRTIFPQGSGALSFYMLFALFSIYIYFRGTIVGDQSSHAS